jgi:hypothetical protein
MGADHQVYVRKRAAEDQLQSHLTRDWCRGARPHRRCRIARPDLGERCSSRLVATAAESCVIEHVLEKRCSRVRAA